MGIFWNGKCNSTNRLDGKIAIVTGSNTGIGKLTALDFVKRGAHVIIACRDTEKGWQASTWIKDKTKDLQNVGDTTVMEIDLSSFDSVKQFTNNFIKNYDNLHLLINNAGVMMCPRQLSVDGYELHMATNHFGHFLLTILLLPLLKKSAPSRVVNVSSLAHILALNTSSLKFNDFNMEQNYNPVAAYVRSKLANILFTKHLAKLLQGTGVNVYCLHPGVINTELTRHVDSAVFSGARMMYHWFSCFMKTPQQGAETTIYCAVDEKTSKDSGLYYSDCKVVTPTRIARNEILAEQLWRKSIEILGLENEEKQLFNKPDENMIE